VNPKIRRWDHIATDAISLADDKAVSIRESPPNTAADKIVWLDLEDGVQIQFSAGGEYRTGDYWLIPARVATGKIEWPQADDLNPQPLPLHGIEHHYALLGFASWPNQKLNIENARFEFWPLFFGVAQSSLQYGQFVHFHEPGFVLHVPDVAKAVLAKAPKARKRVAKKGPASRAEGAPS
jgi:hypothetical protein